MKTCYCKEVQLKCIFDNVRSKPELLSVKGLQDALTAIGKIMEGVCICSAAAASEENGAKYSIGDGTNFECQIGHRYTINDVENLNDKCPICERSRYLEKRIRNLEAVFVKHERRIDKLEGEAERQVQDADQQF